MRLHSLALLSTTLLALSSCAKPAPAPMAVVTPDAAPTPPPMPQLAVTPSAQLGSAPDGLGLKVGSAAPDANLVDVTGRDVSLATLYATGPTFVIFYRGGWCPFCNLQLHELSTSQPQFEAKGVKLVAISVDLPQEEAKTQAKQGVPFPMLSDPKLVAHEAFHVVKTSTPAEIEKLAGYGVDLARYSGEAHGSYAVPAVFLVDTKGIVRFVHVDTDYKTRPSAAQLLGVVDAALK